VRAAGAAVKDLDLRTVMRKRARLVGSTLRARSDAFKAALVRKFAEDFRTELRRGALKPVVDKVGPCGGHRPAHALILLLLHSMSGMCACRSRDAGV